ncbi:bifunctional protein-serine/threonine kinase/phosphatase [Litorilituus sediminis]|uniref:Bifunctional protein-serine/threonine kinase/phosphatase n=2 Tax=Litorilituus sediminis TaxID=718192 RepID=A0A4P6PBU5_9GAMM|nr:bifunctional protein-serine/threonine kinase/phosphatase [Litorilituus sediminis]
MALVYLWLMQCELAVVMASSDIDTLMQQTKKASDKPSQGSLKLSFGGFSTRGEKEENQDAFALKAAQGQEAELKGHVAVIADGVSSANCAAKASQMSVCHFIDEYMATPDTWSVHKSATQVLSALNQWLYSQQLVADAKGELSQWYSTFSALVLKGNRAHLFHVGDCQVAKINADGYQVLTREHATSSGILNRAIGAANHIEIDASTTSLAVNDMFMLSCDGVHQFVKPKQVRRILSQYQDLEVASEKISELAASQGSQDNLTCLLIKVEQLPSQQLGELVFTRRQQVIPPALKVGVKLDHFDVLEVIEQSNRSHVYLARDNHAKRLVVLKVPSVNFTEDEAYITNFIKEGWLGEKISHPGVMQIYPWRIHSKFLYHACEYIEGQTLTTWLADNPKATLAKVRDIAKQIVACLRVFQRHDVVHCDIKLDNFIMDVNGRIKLIDFGSCDIGALMDTDYIRHNQQPLGTMSYSAPELFYGKAANHQSELFSIGVVVYQLLTNALPFGEFSHIEQVPKQYSQWRYRSVTTYRQDLPSWLDMVLSKALSADPNSRYQYYSEFMRDLTSTSLDTVINQNTLPLIERNPVRFWQGVSGGLVMIIAALVFFIAFS